MMVGRQTTPLLLVALTAGLVVVLTGCGSSIPGLGDAQDAHEDGNYQEALSSIDEALERDSSIGRAYALRAKVLRSMADTSLAYDEYVDLYRRARIADERAAELDSTLEVKVRDRRQRVYDQQFQLGEDAYNLGSKNEDTGQFRAAIDYFGAAGATHPDSAQAHLNEVYARLKLGQRAPAIPALERYREHSDSVSREVYGILGQLYIGKGQNRSAADVLDRATTDHPDDEELHALRLKAYNRAGEVDRILDAYREQIEQNPDNATYRSRYGALLIEAKRYTEAIPHLNRAVDIQPNRAERQFNLGAAYLNAAVAQDDSIRALEERPDSTLSERVRERRLSSLSKRRQRYFRKAIPPLERARRMVGDASDVRRNACRALLVAYVQTDRPNRAVQVEECSELRRSTP